MQGVTLSASTLIWIAVGCVVILLLARAIVLSVRYRRRLMRRRFELSDARKKVAECERRANLLQASFAERLADTMTTYHIAARLATDKERETLAESLRGIEQWLQKLTEDLRVADSNPALKPSKKHDLNRCEALLDVWEPLFLDAMHVEGCIIDLRASCQRAIKVSDEAWAKLQRQEELVQELTVAHDRFVTEGYAPLAAHFFHEASECLVKARRSVQTRRYETAITILNLIDVDRQNLLEAIEGIPVLQKELSQRLSALSVKSAQFVVFSAEATDALTCMKSLYDESNWKSAEDLLETAHNLEREWRELNSSVVQPFSMDVRGWKDAKVLADDLELRCAQICDQYHRVAAHLPYLEALTHSLYSEIEKFDADISVARQRVAVAKGIHYHAETELLRLDGMLPALYDLLEPRQPLYLIADRTLQDMKRTLERILEEVFGDERR